MFTSTIAQIVFGALLSICFTQIDAAATPYNSRSGPAVNDITILNYALVLENVQIALYGLALKFDTQEFIAGGLPGSLRDSFVQMSAAETAHVALLTRALGSNPVTRPCIYNFGYTAIFDLADSNRFLEHLVASALLGIQPSIKSPSVATDIARIASMEAQHANTISMARNISDLTQSFGVPLSISQVMNIVETVVVSCPASNPVIPFKKTPFLIMPFAVTENQKTSFSYNATSALRNQPLWMAFIGGTDIVFVPVQNNEVVIPEGILGIAYALLTTSKTKVTDDVTVAGPTAFDVLKG